MPVSTPAFEADVFKALLGDPYNPEAREILNFSPTDWTKTNRQVALYLTETLREYGHLDGSAFVQMTLDHDVDPALKATILEMLGLSYNCQLSVKNLLGRLKLEKAKTYARKAMEKGLEDGADLRAALAEASECLDRGESGTMLQMLEPAHLLDYVPPAIEWCVPGLVPRAVPGIMASKGGLGKSWLALQMCCAGACGKGFLDESFDPLPDSSVNVYFGVEDSKEVLHRRVRAIVERYRARGDWSNLDDECFRENLKLPQMNWGSPKASTYLQDTWPELRRVLMKAKESEYCVPGLVILDTYARMMGPGSNENDASAVQPVLNICNRICDLGYTPILLHHVAKGQEGGRSKEYPTLVQRLSSDWIRGSSSLVDNHRVVLQLAPILEVEAEKAGLDPDRVRAGDFLVLGSSKSNGAPRPRWRFLEQGPDGVWFIPPDADETLTRLQGAGAVARSVADREFCKVWKMQVEKFGMPKPEELAAQFAPESKNPLGWYKMKLYRCRKAGLLPEKGFTFG